MQTLTTGSPGNMRMLSSADAFVLQNNRQTENSFPFLDFVYSDSVRSVTSHPQPERPKQSLFFNKGTENNMPYFGIIKILFYVAKRDETLIYK